MAETATVAMLYSDIEGSTRLLQQLGDAYADVLMEHRALLRSAFAMYGGDEQGTEGDSFFVTFATASDAVGAALAAQRALVGHHWPEGGTVRVRMGVHVGEVQTVAGTIVGMSVHETARIGAAAHGGQVLVSAAAADLAGALTDGAAWRDLGPHRLKDIAAPITLRQLTHAELPTDFAPPRTIGAGRDNLPAQPSAFIGRDAEIAEVTRLLATARILTLTGAGGAGKSRLALRVAAEEAPRFADGVFFVDLAPISDDDAVVGQVINALDLPDAAAADLPAALGTRSLLLVVDNCEHLLDPVADLLDVLMRACPNLVVLATSREPLGLDGEMPWRVPSLSDDDALSLFASRARNVIPGFELTDANRAVVADICGRLDALPLALELAAARTSALGIDQLAARLDQRFRLLAGGSRSRLARQRTLQATVDWSYDLLEPEMQAALCRLGVFVGGFTLEAAEALCDEALDRIDQLVSKSLVVADHHDGSARYRLLETIRQYALDRLVQSGELEAVRHAHAAWVTQLASQVESQLWDGGPDEAGTMRRLEEDAPNLRAGFDWLVDCGRVHDAVKLIHQLFPWQLAVGRSYETIQWILRVLDAPDLSKADRGLVVFYRYLASDNAGGPDPSTLPELEDACDAIAVSKYAWVEPAARAYTAVFQSMLGRRAIADARAFVEGLYQTTAGGNALVRGMTGHALGLTTQFCGDINGARRVMRAVFDEAAAVGMSLGESRAAYSLAQLATIHGDLDETTRWSERGLAAAQRTGDTGMVVAHMTELGIALAMRDDLGAAADLLISALDLATRTRTDAEVAEVQAMLAWYLLQNGDLIDGSAHAAGAVERAAHGNSAFDALMGACEAARLRGDDEQARSLLARAYAELIDTPSAEPTRPVALMQLGAALALRNKDPASAARLLGASVTHDPPEHPLLPAERRRFAAFESEARDALGDEAFDAAWRGGASMSLADAVAAVGALSA
jgi:predicted ATPase/class 3 adenylate cyclase